jgi:hypothetical protein
MTDGPVRSAVCDCGRVFKTTAKNRRKCFSCSPARLPLGHNPQVGESLPVTVIRPVIPEPPEPEHTPGRTELAVLAELTDYGWENTVDGVLALGLAESLDQRDVPGAQRTSMSKQLAAMMGDIRALAPKPPDAIDEVKERLRLLREAAQ